MDFPQEIIDKFMSYIDIKGENDCWEYQRYCDIKGYGVFYVKKGEPYKAHRFAYLLANGKLPDNLCCHSCDNPPCCNPKHLWDGTNKQNMEDMVAKGRGENRPRFKKGNVNRSKLTEEQVISIKNEYTGVPYKNNMSELAEKYKVAKITIYRIIYNQTWSHI